MKKLCLLMTAILTLALGWYKEGGTVYAMEIPLSSRGNMIYQENGREAALYMEDLFLLRDKLSAMPEDVFDPVQYTHTHRWEYRNIDGKTHTRHCSLCGEAFDLTSKHKAERREYCAISFEGKEYAGIRCTCICGYQWTIESGHATTYDAVDGTNHRIRCRLDGTEFCLGYEPVVEEHYAYNYLPCEDGVHHKKVCMDCEYRLGEEACEFTQEAGLDEDDDRDPALLYCKCGAGKQKEADGEAAETQTTAIEDKVPPETPDIPSEEPSEETSEQPAEGDETTPPSEEMPETPGTADTSEEVPEKNEDIKKPENSGENEEVPGNAETPGKEPGTDEVPQEPSAAPEEQPESAEKSQISEEDASSAPTSDKEPQISVTPAENGTEEIHIRYEGKYFGGNV